MEALSRLEREREHCEAANRRRFKRFEVRGEAILEPTSPQSLSEALTIQLRNISRGGLAFLIDHPLEPSSFWRVRFQMEGSGHQIGAQPIRVCYCRPVQGELYLVGGQFVAEPYLLELSGVSALSLREDEMQGTGGGFADEHEFAPPDAVEE